MVPILIASTGRFTGKNMVCLGLALRLKRDGFKTGFCKPFGPLPTHAEGVETDSDVLFFRDVLQLDDALADLCPTVLTSQVVDSALVADGGDARERTLGAFARISQGKDVVLIVSIGCLASGRFLGFSAGDLVSEVDGKVLLVERFDQVCQTVDGILEMQGRLGERLLGVICNRAKPGRSEYLRDTVCPFLERHGVRVFGTIGEDPVLHAVSVGELCDGLNGDMLCCEDRADELVERFSIGAMSMDSALRFFRRQPNKAVIVGGDRADVQLAALETSTKCLILTGELYPNNVILGRAQEAGVPVFVVRADTATTIDKCDDLMGQMSLHSAQKLDRVNEIIESRVNVKAFYEAAGLTQATDQG